MRNYEILLEYIVSFTRCCVVDDLMEFRLFLTCSDYVYSRWIFNAKYISTYIHAASQYNRYTYITRTLARFFLFLFLSLSLLSTLSFSHLFPHTYFFFLFFSLSLFRNIIMTYIDHIYYTYIQYYIYIYNLEDTYMHTHVYIHTLSDVSLIYSLIFYCTVR